ncbi:hypothetical protein [Emticicia fontis]
MNIDLSKIFNGAFDTFKVFNQLNVKQASETLGNTPKSVWQILNHLIVWQAYQIKLLKGEATKHISELDTWSCGKQIGDQSQLDKIITLFSTQIEEIKNELTKSISGIENIENRIKLFQELASHLSFHLGEIILIRRQLKNYPLPHEMTAFLNS